MSATDDIKNNALLLIGATKAVDFTSTTDNKVIVVNSFFTRTKNKLLALRTWTFANKRAEIIADSDSGEYYENENDYYDFRFSLPSDFIKLISISQHPSLNIFYSDYELRGQKILADLTTLYVKYIFSPSDEVLPDYFKELLEHALAANICFKLTGDKVLARELRERAFGLPSENLKGGLFQEAVQTDQIQNPAKTLQSSPMKNARWERI